MKVKDFIPKILKQENINEYFAIPGDYNLALLDAFNKQNIKAHYPLNELNMSYMSDGYARQKNIAVMITTFSVGALSALNGFAGSKAEHNSTLHICCGPRESKEHIFHHTIAETNTDYVVDIYSKITPASYKIKRGKDIILYLKKALDYIKNNNFPAYLEIPIDILNENIEPENIDIDIKNKKLIHLEEKEIINSKKPIIIFGSHSRFYDTTTLLENIKCPYIIMPDAKGMVPENNDHFLGLYWPDISQEGVEESIEDSDLVIYFAPLFNDYNTSGFKQYKGKKMRIVNNIKGKVNNIWKRRTENIKTNNITKHIDLKNIQNIFQNYIHKNNIIFAETGTSWFTALYLRLPKGASFEIQMQYGSIGWALPAALGCSLAQKNKEIILFLGDGAGQMTFQNLALYAKYNPNIIVVFINNYTYAIENAIHKGPYNNLTEWNYSTIVENLNNNDNYKVVNIFSSQDLIKSLEEKKNKKYFLFLNCFIRPNDILKENIIWGKNVSKFNNKPAH
jgi:indolepyruvate decarboxylase